MRCGGNQVLRRGAQIAAEADETVMESPLRPRQCHKYLQKRLSGAFPKIVQGFISEAEKGSCSHMKLAVELLDSAKGDGRFRKGTAQRLLEELGGSL